MGTGMIGMQWIIFIGIAVVSWLVQMNLQNKFKKYSKIPTGNGMTGAVSYTHLTLPTNSRV